MRRFFPNSAWTRSRKPETADADIKGGETRFALSAILFFACARPRKWDFPRSAKEQKFTLEQKRKSFLSFFLIKPHRVTLDLGGKKLINDLNPFFSRPRRDFCVAMMKRPKRPLFISYLQGAKFCLLHPSSEQLKQQPKEPPKWIQTTLMSLKRKINRFLGNKKMEMAILCYTR